MCIHFRSFFSVCLAEDIKKIPEINLTRDAVLCAPDIIRINAKWELCSELRDTYENYAGSRDLVLLCRRSEITKRQTLENERRKTQLIFEIHENESSNESNFQVNFKLFSCLMMVMLNDLAFE